MLALGRLLDFKNRDTLKSFVMTSRLAWYILLNTLFLLIAVNLVRADIASMLTIGTLTSFLLMTIYHQRQLERRLVTVNGVTEKLGPAGAADFIRRLRPVDESCVKYHMMHLHLAARRLKALKDKPEAKQQELDRMRQHGLAVDYAALGEHQAYNQKATLVEAMDKSGANAYDKYRYQALWASGMGEELGVFLDDKDRAFQKNLMRGTRNFKIAAIAVVCLPYVLVIIIVIAVLASG
mmetsp:Transcript_18669/g.62585  ORF Transcript_18669/g.62585 Transcript_18669/m.62585 type:complete len:237 (+) Transcript_18669:425-1135(+)